MRLKTLMAATVSLAASAASAATVTIDDFDLTNFQVVGAPTFGNSPVNPATTSGPTNDAIGGIRTITNTRTNPPGTANGFGQQVQSTVANGSAFVFLADGVSGTSVFSWNAGGFSLIDGTNDRILIDVLATDQTGIGFELNADGASVTRFASGPSLLSYAFSEFGGVDFDSVGAISLTISGPVAFGTNFDNIRASVAPMAAVPLPAALPMLLAGIGGLTMIRRKRKSA